MSFIFFGVAVHAALRIMIPKLPQEKHPGFLGPALTEKEASAAAATTRKYKPKGTQVRPMWQLKEVRGAGLQSSDESCAENDAGGLGHDGHCASDHHGEDPAGMPHPNGAPALGLNVHLPGGEHCHQVFEREQRIAAYHEPGQDMANFVHGTKEPVKEEERNAAGKRHRQVHAWTLAHSSCIHASPNGCRLEMWQVRTGLAFC